MTTSTDKDPEREQLRMKIMLLLEDYKATPDDALLKDGELDFPDRFIALFASQATAAQERAVLEARIEMLEHYFAIAPNEIPDRIAVLKSQLASLHQGKDKESI